MSHWRPKKIPYLYKVTRGNPAALRLRDECGGGKLRQTRESVAQGFDVAPRERRARDSAIEVSYKHEGNA